MAGVDVKDKLASLVKGRQADYVEIRLEESYVSKIEFKGTALENISKSVIYGGNVRALVDGSWGFVSFNTVADLDKKVEEAIAQARLAGPWTNSKVVLAEVPVVVETVRLELAEDPRSISLERKKQILEEYNDIVLSYDGPIASSNIYYIDKYSKLWYANSEGSLIEQEKMDISGRISALASRDGDTQSGSVSFGSSTDFSCVKGLGQRVERACATACALLKAPVAEGREYTVILDPYLAGVFVHEAFGHLSEADMVYENESLKEVMVLGRTFGGAHLNIVDSGITPGARGYLKYDDEGVKTEKTYLIREGRLVGRLHSRETAARMGERPTGNARAIDYQFPPIVRMRNTSIEAGDASFEDMLSGVKDGIYALSSYGGETMGEMFTFTAREAYRIRNGQICELVKNATLSGNVFSTLKNIDMVGKDFTVNDTGGGCGKNGQSPLPTSEWSPHVRIQKALIGGRS